MCCFYTDSTVDAADEAASNKKLTQQGKGHRPSARYFTQREDNASLRVPVSPSQQFSIGLELDQWQEASSSGL